MSMAAKVGISVTISILTMGAVAQAQPEAWAANPLLALSF